MAVIDDILGNGTQKRPRINVRPAPVDSSLDASTVTPKPSTPSATPQTAVPQTAAQQNIPSGTQAKPAQAPVATAGADVVKTEDPRMDVKIDTDTTKAAAPARIRYEDFVRMFNPNKPETDEDRRKREKKERLEGVFTALGDGISAMSNLYFTTKGAPNAQMPSMSAKAKERWDKLKSERDANSKAYYEALERARRYDDEKEKDDRNWRLILERERKADDRYAAEQKRKDAKDAQEAEMHALNKLLADKKITKAEHEAKEAEIKAKYADKINQGKVDELKSRVTKNNAQANAANAKARESEGEFTAYDIDGTPKQFHTKEAADDFALRVGTYHPIYNPVSETTTVTETKPDKDSPDDKNKMVTTTKTVKKVKNKGGGYSKKPEKPVTKKANPMGSSGKSNKKPNPMS